MDIKEYMSGVAGRYNSLEPEAKMELKAFIQSEPAALINYLLGPEMKSLIDYIQKDLNNTSGSMPQEQMPEDVMLQEPMMQEPTPPVRPGLGARR